MPNFGKKILSAFVDIQDEPTEETSEEAPSTITAQTAPTVGEASSEKFKLYFEKLFQDSNTPGPDYFEFAKMIEAMQSIPDEKTRYLSAFAGLSVQGLDKSKLIASAEEYLKILQSDSTNFNSTINNAVSEKVELKKKQLEEKSQKIQQLNREINDLNNEITGLGNEIKENEEKIHNTISGYAVESGKFKAKIEQDIQKINSLL